MWTAEEAFWEVGWMLSPAGAVQAAFCWKRGQNLCCCGSRPGLITHWPLVLSVASMLHYIVTVAEDSVSD